jgi:hypothetical protein
MSGWRDEELTINRFTGQYDRYAELPSEVFCKAVPIQAFGESFHSIQALAEDSRCIVCEDTLYWRIRKGGWEPEEAATTKLKAPSPVHAFGEDYTSLADLANDLRCVVPYSTLLRRVRNGQTPEEAATREPTKIMVEVFGTRMRLRTLARHPSCVVPYGILYQRIVRYGWNPEKAAITPAKKRRRK